jgi:hypothetical protein
MKLYYVLSIAGAAVISTLVGSTLVAASTPKADTVTVQSASLELLTAESAASTTWRRPL